MLSRASARQRGGGQGLAEASRALSDVCRLPEENDASDSGGGADAELSGRGYTASLEVDSPAADDGRFPFRLPRPPRLPRRRGGFALGAAAAGSETWALATSMGRGPGGRLTRRTIPVGLTSTSFILRSRVTRRGDPAGRPNPSAFRALMR